MIIILVKIISARMPTYWYANHIGKEFFVTNHIDSDWNDNYKVIPVGIDNDYGMCYIEKGDAEIIESFDGEIVTEIRVVKTGELDGEK